MIDRHVAFAAAGFVVAGEHGDAFEQRGFTGTVLADDDGDRLVERELELVTQERQAIRIGGAALDARRIDPQSLQIPRWQIDRAIFSGHSSSPISEQLQLEAARTQSHTTKNVTRTILASGAAGRACK